MKILSIYYGHNATVGFSDNGEMVFLGSEERMKRAKNYWGFPFSAKDFVVEKFLNGDANNCDAVYVIDESLELFDFMSRHQFICAATDYRYKAAPKILSNYLKHKKESKSLLGFFKRKKKIKNIDRDAAINKLSQLIGVKREKIRLLNHHMAHAYAGCFFNINLNNEHLVFTLDGMGDGICASVNILKDGRLKVISTVDKRNSPGTLYAAVTAYLGMKPLEHEFKVMGLAPYAYSEQAERICAKFERALRLNEKGEFDSAFDMTECNYFLMEELLFERFDNIAGGLQLFTERLMCGWIKKWTNKTGIKSIVLGGGMFMNVKAAKRISEMDEVNSIFVVPSAGDESVVIGGCYYGNMLNGKVVKPINTLYLGRSFDDDFIAEYLEKEDIGDRYLIEKYDEDEMAVRVARLLAGGEIVARCCGREEWGARALGNRSILANPSDFETINIINQKIKSRDFWMPFTPSILDENFNDYIVNPKNIHALYMCITFDSTGRAKKELRAAIHPKDKTVRPQVVEERNNPGYYKIIKEFKKITGIGAVLNTSFNLHGEPNVSEPKDALHTLDNSDLNYLILGSYLLSKKVDGKDSSL